MMPGLADPPRPIHKTLEQLANELFRRVVRQISLCVKPLGGVPDHHLRLVDRKHVEEHFTTRIAVKTKRM